MFDCGDARNALGLPAPLTLGWGVPTCGIPWWRDLDRIKGFSP